MSGGVRPMARIRKALIAVAVVAFVALVAAARSHTVAKHKNQAGGRHSSMVGAGTWVSIAPGQVSTDFNNPPNNFGFNAIVLDPTDPHVLFITTNYQGLWKSTDQGATWAKVNTGPGANLLDQGRLWSLAIDPFNHNTLWTTSGYGAGGPLKSTDGGVSWTLMATPTAITTNDVYSIYLDPYTANHLIVAFHYWWNSNQDSGVAESSDGGNTWSLHYPPGGSGWGAGNAAWFLDNSHTWLLGSQHGGIWRTTDSGGHWTKVRNQNITHGGINSLVRDPASGVLYLADETTVGISTDNGLTWTDPPGLTYSDYETVVSDATNIYTAPSFPTGGQNIDGPWYYLAKKGGTSWKPYNSQHTCYKGNCNGPVMGAYDATNHIAYAANWRGGVWKLQAA